MASSASWSLAELMRETGCGDQCGLCRPYLRQMLATGETTFSTILLPDPE
jgi:bacterioferritin-associated ferredoxin